MADMVKYGRDGHGHFQERYYIKSERTGFNLRHCTVNYSRQGLKLDEKINMVTNRRSEAPYVIIWHNLEGTTVYGFRNNLRRSFDEWLEKVRGCTAEENYIWVKTLG